MSAVRAVSRRAWGRPLAAALAILAGSLLTTWYTAQSWFAADDIYNFGTAHASRMRWAYLRQPIFQHFAPSHRLGDWLSWHYAPLDWTLAVGAMQVTLAIAAAALIALLDRLCGRRWQHLVIAFVVAGAYIWAESIMWWANALHSVPATAASLIALYCAVRAFGEQGWRWPLGAALAMAVGFTFFEKPALVVAYALLLRVLVFSPSLKPRLVVAGLARAWRLWVSLGVVAGGWYAYYSHYNYAGSVPRPSLTTFEQFLRITWLRGFVPGMFGIRIDDPATTAQNVGVIAVQVILVAFVIATIAWRRQAWRAWLFFGVGFMLNAILIGRERAGIFGPDIGRDPRYWPDYMLLFLVAAALATSRTWPREPAAALPREGARFPRSVLPVTGVAAAVAVAFVVLTAHSDRAALNAWIGPKVRTYVHNARAEVRAAEAHGPVVILDRPVPNEVVGAFLDPWNRSSVVMPTLGLNRLKFGTRADGLMQIDNDGHLVRVGFKPAAAAATGITDGNLVPQGKRRCAAGPTALVLAAPKLLQAPNTDLRFVGTASRGASIPVTVDTDGNGFPAFVKGTLPVSAGPTSAALDLSNSIAKLRLDIPPGVVLCVRSAGLGRYAPVGSAR